MADMIKVPGVGPVKKVYVIAGVGVLGGVLVYAYWKRSTTPAVDVAPVADTSAYDTSSDYTEDSTAAGYNTVYPSAYSQSPYGYDIYGNPLPAPTGAGSGGVYTTNSDWATAAESALEDGGVTLSVSTLAISRVLGGLSVTADQRDLFLQAVGLLGQPPQGYPTPIKLTDSGTGPPSGGGTTYPPGGTLPGPQGLHVTSTTSTTIGLGWFAVPYAAKYRVYRRGVANHIAETTSTSAHIGSLQKGTTYYFHVRAVGHDGQYGQSSGEIHATTKK